MKHPLIILGSICGLILLGVLVWGYFFLVYERNAPLETTAKNPFAEGLMQEDFNQAGGGTAVFDTDSPLTANGFLRQLTVRKVAGAVYVHDSNTYRFVEAGTGHLFEVTQEGAETKISNTTFGRTTSATWSRAGTRVAITYTTERGAEVFVGALGMSDTGERTLTGEILPGAVSGVTFGDESDTLQYVVKEENGSQGIIRDLKTNTEITAFRTPLRDIIVSWEPEIHITTKASAYLPGAMYTKDMARIFGSLNGLTMKAISGGLVFSGLQNSLLTSWIVKGNTTITIDRSVIPEKCAEYSTKIICAIPKSINADGFPDEWYRGDVSYSDELWSISEEGIGERIGDLETVAGRALDTLSLSNDGNGGLLLIAKNDQSLWLVTVPGSN